MKKLTAVIGISFVLLLCLLPFMCNRQGCGSAGKGGEVVGRDTVRETDTVTIVRTDTLWQDRVVYLPTSKPSPLPRPRPKPDSVETGIAAEDGATAESGLNVYKDSAQDETVKIGYTAFVKGTLDSLQLFYQLLAPKTVTNTVETTITNTNTVTEKMYLNGFYLGGAALVDWQGSDAEISAMLTLKGGGAVGYSYGVLRKSHRLSAMYRLFPKNPDK